MTDGGSATIELPSLGTVSVEPSQIEPMPDATPQGAPDPNPPPGPKKRDYKAERERRARGETRKRGRPTNAERAARGQGPAVRQELHTGEPPTEPAGMSDEEMAAFSEALALAFRLSSQLVAARRGAHWLMEVPESQLHGAAWAAALAPWAGSLGKWLPLATASVLLVSAIATRVEQDARAAADVKAGEGQGNR